MKRTISFYWTEQSKSYFLLKCTIFCFLVSIFCAVKKLFEIENMSYSALVILIISVIILEYQRNHPYIFRYIKFGFVLLVICSFPLWLQGITTLYNEIAENVGKTLGYAWTQYEVKDRSFYAMFLIAVFFAYVIHWSVKRMSSIIYIIMALFIFMWEIISNASLHWLHNTTIILLLTLVVWLMKQPKLEFNVLTQIGTIAIVLSCIILGLALMIKQPSWQKDNSIMTYSKKLWEHWLFGGENIDWHTNGDMQKLGKGKATHKKALIVMMEKPTSLYLRGFVGANYVHNKWQTLTEETYYNEQPLLHGLRENELSSNTLLAKTYQLTEKTAKSEVRMYPQNVSKKYSYTPYELATQATSLGFEYDGLNEKNTWTKKERYSYIIEPAARVHYPITASKLKTSKTNPILLAEGHYNEFAYKQYLKMDKRDRTIIQTHLGNQSKVRLPYEIAIKEVQKFVKKELRYDENVGQIPEGKNFVQYTLEDRKRGYSPHYATIATLTFRYLGIPARYVEGYLVTPDLIKHKQSYTDITITGEEAHAWVEIYIDQLGWVPIEVTPGFENKMPKLETLKADQKKLGNTISSPQKSMQRGEETKQQLITDQDTTIEPTPKKENNNWSIMKRIIWLGSLFFLFTIIFIGWLIYRKRRKLNKWKKSLQSYNQIVSAKAAITILEWKFEHILKITKPETSLYSWSTVLPAYMIEPFKDMIDNYQSIRYSQNQKESTELLRIYRNIQQYLDKDLTIYQKMKLWVKGFR